MPTAGPVQINAYSDGDGLYIRADGQTAWTALPCTANSITVTYLDNETYWDGSMAITAGTNSYTINADQWVWHTSNITMTANAGTNDWVWRGATNGTGSTYRWQETIDAWDRQHETLRVQRAQGDLQRATTAARGAGDMRHEWNIGEWAADCDVDLEDFTDEQSGLVMETYLHSWALAENAHFDQERRAERARQADARAEHLLTSLLSAAQKREWLASRWVTEISPTGRIWRVMPLGAGGQLLMDPDNPEVRYATLCVHPRGQMPAVDHMVGVLLAVRNGDEDMLLAKANVHSGALRPEDRDLAQEYRNRLYAPTAPAAVAAEAIVA